MSKTFEKLLREEDKFDLKKDKDEIAMTSRGLADYMDILKLTEKELDDPDLLILDLGSGLEQNFAKDIRKKDIRSKIISVDPKLGLSDDEDLSSIINVSDKETRIQARKNTEPRTVAGLSGALPFLDNVFSRIYAVYSAPYYLSHPEDIEQTLKEMIRVLKPGGIIKAVPIEDEQSEIVKNFLKSSDDVSFSIKQVRTAVDYENLLTVTKK